jgi:hypothetical protein
MKTIFNKNGETITANMKVQKVFFQKIKQIMNDVV